MTKEIEIPKEFMGVPITKDTFDRVLSQEKPKPEHRQNENYTLKNPREYIQVPEHNMVIALQETHNGKNMYDTLEALASEGLNMPSIAQFTRHFLNVQEASQSKRTLLYADGTPVSDDVAKDLWNYMSSTDRSRWNGKPSWTWLNALFKNKDKKWYIETDLEVKTDADGNKILQGRSEPLDACLMKDGWASLKFNNQGLATEASSLNGYKQEDNLYFWHPKNNCVAWFNASSGWVDFSCGEEPRDSNGRLGVLAAGDAQNFDVS